VAILRRRIEGRSVIAVPTINPATGEETSNFGKLADEQVVE
jgi:hypothetical protein